MGSPKRQLNVNKLAPRDRQGVCIGYSSPRNQLRKEQSDVKHAASKTLHLDSLCQRGTVSNREQAWKPHNLSLLSRGITKKLKCIQNTDTTSLFFFFNTLAYNMKKSLSVWISWRLVWTAKPGVLTAQEGAGLQDPARCLLYHSHRALACIWIQAATDAQGQAIRTSLKGAVCLAGHAALLQAALCPLVLGWETKPCRNTRVLTQENQPAILVLGPLSSEKEGNNLLPKSC